MTTTNITCWVSMVDYKKKEIHMSFDIKDNDKEKLENMTSNLIRKRITKNGFVIKGDLQVCKELDNLIGKKIVIRIRIERYKFIPDKKLYNRGYWGRRYGYINNLERVYNEAERGDAYDKFIEGYNFRTNEYPFTSKKDYKKYIVLVEDTTIQYTFCSIFYQ